MMMEAGNDKTLDLELLLTEIGGIFKPDQEASEEDNTLQAALSKFAKRISNIGEPLIIVVPGPRWAKNQDL